MTPLAIINLVTQVGWPLASKLIDLYHAGNAATTPQDWADLKALGAYTPADSLAKLGIAIVDGKVVPV